MANKEQIPVSLIDKSVNGAISIVAVNKTTATTLIAYNASRIGMAFYNSSNLDVYIRFNEAALNNNMEGWVLKGGETVIMDNVRYLGEVSSIRATTTGSVTPNIHITEW